MGLEKLAWIFFTINACSSVREVRVSAPAAAARGHALALRCDYDMEHEQLYCVKWYRGDAEFARYTPRDVPPLKVFPVPGLEVVVGESDARRLTLARAEAPARFVCEVSADAPSFQTERAAAYVDVAVFPAEGPRLVGVKPSYRPGSKLRAECVSRAASPPANLTFTINDHAVPWSSRHVYRRVEADRGGGGGLMTSHATLQLQLQKHDFIEGKIKIGCTAHMFSTYRRSVQRVALEQARRPAAAAAAAADAGDLTATAAAAAGAGSQPRRRKADRHMTVLTDSSGGGGRAAQPAVATLLSCAGAGVVLLFTCILHLT